MTPEASTVDFIRRILSVAETGAADFDPGAVYKYNDGPNRKAQWTLSLGFTELGGNLKPVIERYIELGGELKDDFEPYMAQMGKKHITGSNFKSLLQRAGKEPVMKQAQEELFEEKYLAPAFAWAEKHGFKEPLSYLVIADSYLHSGSMLPFLMQRFPEKKPIDGGDEKAWIKAYLETRHKWLRTHSNKILNKTTYRIDTYLRAIAQNNWDLDFSSIVMNGTPVSRVA